MQHPETNIGFPGLCWGKEEQTAYAHVPLMIGIEVSRIPGSPASTGNLVSHVWVDGNGNMSLVLTNWKPWSGLGPDSCGPVPEILEE